MKKLIIAMMIAFTAPVVLTGCVVSEQKLSDKVQEAIVAGETAEGKPLEVREFTLGEKRGKIYRGVLKGTVNGQEVVYDVAVTDEGSDFDVDWKQR